MRLVRPLTAAALVLALAGCLPLAAAVPGAMVGAVGLYCAAVSDHGKTVARDALTQGTPLIACPESDPGSSPQTDHTREAESPPPSS